MSLFAQVNIGGKPYSIENELRTRALIKNEYDKVRFSSLDLEKLTREDISDESQGYPPRFGYSYEVKYDLTNSGIWFELENGNRVWNLEIYCPAAKSINLLYDKFNLPDNTTLYIYNSHKTHIIGGFTKQNNKGSKEKPGKFGTGLVFGERIILEYYEPKAVKGEGIISISRIIHGYRYVNIENNVRSFGDAPCSVNINCSPEGDDWQKEKTSVALTIVNGNRWCTGSLINNVRNDGTFYFLTANHCLDGWAISRPLDAIDNPDANDWSFYWNYENPQCANGKDFTSPSTVGAIVKANGSLSDFALLQLSETPYELTPQIKVYFNGWDRRVPSGKTVGIHHPEGDMKKISIANNSPITNGYTWRVYWDTLSNGNSILYGGSSGSPLYNNQKKVIGQTWSVNGFACSSQYAYYGKFDVSWNSNGSIPERKLSNWLDPDNTNVMFLDGCGDVNFTNQIVTVNTTVTSCGTLNVQNVTVSNNAKLTLDAPGDVIINSPFEVQFGSQLDVQ